MMLRSWFQHESDNPIVLSDDENNVIMRNLDTVVECFLLCTNYTRFMNVRVIGLNSIYV